MSLTTIIGVVSGVVIIGGEYWLTGSVSETTIATGLSIMGLGWFAADGKALIPIFAKLLNRKNGNTEPVEVKLAQPERLPNVEEKRRQMLLKVQREERSRRSTIDSDGDSD